MTSSADGMRSRRLRTALAILVALGSQEAMSTSWSPRVDLGVAAVDRRTGSVLWEAWDESDLAADVTAGVRSAFRQLLVLREPTDAEAPGPSFPVPLAPDKVVKYLYSSDSNRVELILSRGSEKSPGEELARFSFASGSAFYARGQGTLYVLIGGRLHALSLRGAKDDGMWLADWTFDLVDPPAGREKALAMPPWTLLVEGDGLWVADDRRIRRFGPAGRLDFDHVIREPWAQVRNGFNSPLTPGDRAVYYRHGTGVIAVDRATGLETWRVPTWRYPYPSRVLEADDVVLIQVGSNCPQAILGAFAEGAHPLPRLGPNMPKRLVAATALLRSYGDGYPRAALRKWIARARSRKADEELRHAVTAIERLLESWPAKRDRQRLVDFSVDSLFVPPGTRSPASPAVDRALTWTLIQELIYGRSPDGYGRPGMNYAFDTWDENPVPLTEGRKRALVAECRRVVAGGRAEEMGLAAGVLLSDAVGWSSVSESELAGLFLSPHESVWRWAGMSLAKHGRRDELVELARHRPEKEHLSVIYMLANALPAMQSEVERRFWLDCVKRTPASIAYVLALTRPAEIPREYREPIRAYLVAALREASTSPKTPPNESTQREYDVNAALRVLDRWHDPEDTSVIASYLTHPHPFVRQHAKALLDGRRSGGTPPANAPPLH